LSRNKSPTRLPFGHNSGYIDSEEERHSNLGRLLLPDSIPGSSTGSALPFAAQAAVSSKIMSSVFQVSCPEQDFDETGGHSNQGDRLFSSRIVCPTFRTSHKETMRTRTPRTSGFVVHVGESRTAGFWAIIKDSHGTLYFAYGLSFLNPAVIPRVGWECGFAVLPPAPGHPLKRATEVSGRQRSSITSVARLVLEELRSAARE
jgi:hypothetical protein